MVWSWVSYLGQALVYRVGGWNCRTSRVVSWDELECKLEAWDCCGLGVEAEYVGLG